MGLVALVAFGETLKLRPFNSDDLMALSWASTATPTSFIHGNAVMHPEWRPLPYLTVWLQYQVVGLQHIWSWYLINIALWAMCAYLAYMIIYLSTQSQPIAIVVSLFLLFDPRAAAGEPIHTITGRQTTLACLFGLGALLLLLSRAPRLGGRAKIGLYVLLLASGLSKEYGLAFSGAALVLVLCWPAYQERGSAALVVTGALLTYFMFRFSLVSSSADYCNQMGFFTELRSVCYSHLDFPSRMEQHVYNVAATLVGIPIRGLLSGNGVLGIVPEAIAASAIWLPLALAGWRKKPREGIVMLSLVVFNAFLSFTVYRERNQIIGAVGLYAAAGLGLASLWSYAKAHSRGVHAVASTAPLLFVLLLIEATLVRSRIDMHIQGRLEVDPCRFLRQLEPERFERSVIVDLKRRYRMANPTCVIIAPPPG